MELRILKYFLMVAREENITKAALLLHVTQPTLSRQLMQLEEELGVSLFRRSNHNIVLTQEGLLLKRRAQEIVELEAKARSEFAKKDEELSGEITIGTGESRSMSLFSAMLTSFHALHPLVRFSLYSGNADHVKDRIEQGLLDIGLLMEPVDISKYDFVRLPMKEQWGLLVPEASDLAKRSAIVPADLVGLALMTPGRTLVQEEIAAWAEVEPSQLNLVLTYNLLNNVAWMVKQGLGAALCLHLDVHYDGLTFVSLQPQMEVRSVIVWKKNQTTAAATAAFIDYAKKYDLSMARDSE